MERRITNVSSPAAVWHVLHNIGFSSESFPSPLTHLSPDTINSHLAAVASLGPDATHVDLQVLLNGVPVDGDPFCRPFAFEPITHNQVIITLCYQNSRACEVDELSAQILRLTMPALAF